MSVRNTIIAVIIALIIGGYALVVGVFSKPLPPRTALKVKPDQITSITLKYPHRVLKLARAEGQWNIVEPIQVEANQTAANNLARAIANADVTKSFKAKPAELAHYGLNPPAVVVTVTAKAAVRGKAKKTPGLKIETLPSIDVGGTTPVGFSSYIATSDKPDEVLMTSSAFPIGMKKTLSDMRDRTLMTFKVGDVNRLVLEHADGTTIELDKQGGRWEIVKPKRYPADPVQVREVLSALARSRIVNFTADTPVDVNQYGLNRPRLTAVIYCAGAPSQSLLFGFQVGGKDKDAVYVRRGESTPVYTVHGFVLNEVNKTVFQLRDKILLHFKPSEVDRVTVNDSSGTFSLKRAPQGKWQITVGKGKPVAADIAVAERLLEQVQDLKGTSIAADPMKDPSNYGMNKPAVTIALAGRNGKPIGTVKLAAVKTKQIGSQPVAPTTYYATSSAGTAVYTIGSYIYGQLSKSPVEFGAAPRTSAAPAARKRLAPLKEPAR